MTHRTATRGVAQVASSLIVSILLVAAIGSAQTFRSSALQLELRTASIQRSNGIWRGKPGSVWLERDFRWFADWVTVQYLIQAAYGIEAWRIVSGPDWIASERFNIVASFKDVSALREASQTSDRKPFDDLQQWLRAPVQAVLADRFQLRGRRTLVDRPAYALVFFRPERTLSRSDTQCARQLAVQEPGAPAAVVESSGDSPTCAIIWKGIGELVSTGVTMETLANTLMRPAGIWIVDQTGLAGRYDFTLRHPALGPRNQFFSPPSNTVASLTRALEEQLGLTLKPPQRSKVEAFVIDRVSRPRLD